MSLIDQVTDTLLMVRPARFGYNPQTAADNAFQSFDSSLSELQRQTRAEQEFDNLVKTLIGRGVDVITFHDTLEPDTPDAVFPNNWISFHKEEQIITYPMFSPIRRAEKRLDMIEQIQELFHIKSWHKLDGFEAQNKFLEGTGSLVLDRIHKIAYASKSERTQEIVLDEFCRIMGYQKVFFNAVDENAKPIYHTNVMMALGIDFVIICLESIRALEEQKALLKIFQETGKTVFEISMQQVRAFAGNMLQVKNKHEETFLVMSQTALESLQQSQVEDLRRHTHLLSASIPTIETFGGGSVRCMMAEVF